jgi:tRNA(Ile2) C34 agmatinyltransferase TiaS
MKSRTNMAVELSDIIWGITTVDKIEEAGGVDMVVYDEEYPMCGDCGVELEYAGDGEYFCPICKADFDVEPPTPAQRQKMIHNYM